MSANNQTLIISHKGKYYVFYNIMAESWSHYNEDTNEFDDNRTNEMTLDGAIGVYDTIEEARKVAYEVDDSEYGVHIDILAKDGGSVKIIE